MDPNASRGIADEPCHCGANYTHSLDAHPAPRDHSPIDQAAIKRLRRAADLADEDGAKTPVPTSQLRTLLNTAEQALTGGGITVADILPGAIHRATLLGWMGDATSHSYDADVRHLAAIITAGLTARPDGAERLEQLLTPHLRDHLDAIEIADLADTLATAGIHAPGQAS